MSEDSQKFEEADVASHAHRVAENDEPATEVEESEVEAHILREP